MPSMIFSLVSVFLINLLIEPTACTLPMDLRHLKLDDITLLQHEFSSVIGKIKVIVNQLQCPKGWRHFGGSCYYLSKITSTPIQANHTCNLLHSNHSNLMQIRNTVDLFYAAHLLTKNNLSALMIDIGKSVTEISTGDQRQWQRMKDKFRELRVGYDKLKEKMINELNAADLHISIRSKKIKQSVKKRIGTNNSFSNDAIGVDEYEYDNLDSEDESDEFKQMDDVRGICDQIDWNVVNNDSTVYMLTTSLRSDKMICSLSNVEPNIEYRHVCEYVLNFCYANTECGKHGRCVNTLSGFKCSCSFLYGGLLCERFSNQAKQVIIGLILICVLYGLSIRTTQWVLIFTLKSCIHFCKSRRKRRQNNIEDGTQKKLVQRSRTAETREQNNTDQCLPVVPLKPKQFIFPEKPDATKNENKQDLIRLFWVGGLSILFLTLSLSLTMIIHFTSFEYDRINDTVQLVAKCGRISGYRTKIVVFFPIALALIFVLSWTIKRERRCLRLCNGRPGLISPMEPFRLENRFTTAAIFGILAFEILKAFDEYLFSTGGLLGSGILIVFLEIIALALLIGFRYYLVLASLQLRNTVPRFFVCLYVLADIIYTIIREGSCMGFSPTSGYYSAFKEANLPMEHVTWSYIIYGLIKNTPHFILLSFVAAELFVRFAYDSIYVQIKKKRSIWSSPVTQPDDAAFAKYYVNKLLRRNLTSYRTVYSSVDFEYKAESQRKRNPSRVNKFLDSVYHWDNDFHFTTMIICTYTVAVVVLYYLACTLVFLYIPRTTGYISFLRYYIEKIFHIEFRGFFALRSIIISAVITVGIITLHLYIGIQNYKKHKLQLFKGIYDEIPSVLNFKSNAIASNSVRYFGFLVGHMACGFVILFHLIIFILCAIRIIFLQIPYVEMLLAITVPVLVLYLLTMVTLSSVGKVLYIRQQGLHLRNRKVYANFVYFSFFVDCSLGFASCFIRLIKATLLNVIYIGRLDCSLYGRPVEKFDLGFAAYVSYLHMEVAHTNPIMLGEFIWTKTLFFFLEFCYSLYDDVIQRRPKQDDGLDNNEINIELKPKVTKKVYSKNVSKNGSQKSERQISTDTQEDEEEQVQGTPLQTKLKPIPNVSTAYSATSYLFEPEEAREYAKTRRQKQARFRWFLAYTILNNYHLFDLKKRTQYRLALLRIERSNLLDEQSIIETESPESPAIRQRETKCESDVDDYYQSPAERYIACRSRLLSDVNRQQVDRSLSTDGNLQPPSNSSPVYKSTSIGTEV